jgi:hypothetical protein
MPYQPDVAGTLNNLGVLYSNTGRLAEADKADSEVTIYRDLVSAADPDFVKYADPDFGTRCSDPHRDIPQVLGEAQADNYKIPPSSSPRD